ncbi:unnamed protein product [Ilex paraguariensis]|uniref:BHLH domain-containing protein n=1 Tax=Ilex paraguariensis TaxID=185542 RepID=A0ABC8SMJ9_9AQUA
MYGDSRAYSADSIAIFPSTWQPKREEIAKSKEPSMDSESRINFHDYRQYQHYQNNSGLLRFRSAPSSLLASSTDGVVKNCNSNQEHQGLNSRFSSSTRNGTLISESFHDLEDNKPLDNGSYSLSSQYPPQYPRQVTGTQVYGVDYRVVSSMGMEHQGQGKLGSNLMRKNNSPVGFFSHLTAQNGYATMRGIGNYRLENGSNDDLSPPSSRLKGQMNFSSRVPSSLGILSRISENESENIAVSGPEGERLGNGNGETQFSSFGYPFGSWNDSSQFTPSFTGLKGERDDDGKLIAAIQNGELGNHMPILSHHLSLPKTSAEMTAMEKLLQFQDSVPCKIRAKRGCATHPRSIAERVRRTRISERMRKLQELVPNMDKQTNTADMLDLAVEYIKDLQKQYKTLSDNRASCKCSSMQKSDPNQTV